MKALCLINLSSPLWSWRTAAAAIDTVFSPYKYTQRGLKNVNELFGKVHTRDTVA